MPHPDLETGRTRLNRQLAESAASLAGPAADLAMGASKLQVASNFLKDAALEKLLGPTALFAGSLVGVLRTVRGIVRETGVLEKGLRRIASVQGIQGKFETLLGSVTAAKRKIEELYRLTARSPFDLGDVAEAARILQSLTRGAFAGTKAMEIVGDMAAATGSRMADAAEKVGKLYAALASGRSLDRIAFQLEFSGVPYVQELMAKLEGLEASGASFASKWAAVEEVFKRTSGGMKNEIENLDALRTRLDNANAAMAQAFGENYVEAQVRAMKLMIAATENLTPLVREIGKDFSVVPNFIRDSKNQLLDTVAASRAFADALRVAYKLAVSLFVGLASATLVMAARNLTALSSATLATGQAMRATYTALLAQAKAQSGLALATALSTSASKAFASGSLLSAAALKVESFWIGFKTRALVANAAAARLAGAGTASYSVASHAAGLAVAGLGGAVKLTGKALGLLAGIVRGSAVALFSNPWAATALAVGTLATMLYKWGSAARDAAQDARELAASIADTTKRLDEQSAAVKTISDWEKQVERLRSRYAELTAQITEMHRRVANGETPTREEAAAHNRAVDEWKQTRVALDREMRRNTRNLGLSDTETEAIRQDQANRRAAQDQKARLAVGFAQTPEQRLAAMEERRAALENRVRDGRAAKDGETRALRNGEAAMRVSLEQRRADLVARFDQREQQIKDRRDNALAKVKPGSQIARDIIADASKQLRALAVERNARVPRVEEDIRNLGLFSASPVARAQAQLDEAVRLEKGPAEIERLTRALEDARAAVAGLADAEAELAEVSAQLEQDERELGRTRATQTLANQYDERINDARRAGLPVGGLEFEKAMALAEVKRNDAQTPEDRQSAQNEIDAMLAEREAGRREVEREREKNAALARGDRKDAQALDDSAALRAQRDRYAALGLSTEQADADFRASLLADAMGRNPSVVASSLASIGGGGGAYQGQDPMVSAMERANRAQEQTARETAAAAALLREIRNQLGDD